MLFLGLVTMAGHKEMQSILRCNKATRSEYAKLYINIWSYGYICVTIYWVVYVSCVGVGEVRNPGKVKDETPVT